MGFFRASSINNNPINNRNPIIIIKMSFEFNILSTLNCSLISIYIPLSVLVKMEQPKFIIGNEKRFADFISSMENAKKIILISHTDLDGLGSARVVDKALAPDKIFFVQYHELNDSLVEKLKKEKPTHIIFTDLFFRKEFIQKIEKFSKILVIDHHIPEDDFNSDKTFFLNSSGTGFCASYLCYYLFSKVKNIEKIDWLVACACISDFCYNSNKEWIRKVAKKYGIEFDGGMIENAKGKLWELQWKISLALIYFQDPKKVYQMIGDEFADISKLEKYANKVQEEFNHALRNFDKERITLNEGYFWEVKEHGLKSLLSNWLSAKEPNKTLIFGEAKEDSLIISARRQDGKVNMKELLQKLVSGFEAAESGGHFKAAGAHILLKDKDEFKKRLLNL